MTAEMKPFTPFATGFALDGAVYRFALRQERGFWGNVDARTNLAQMTIEVHGTAFHSAWVVSPIYAPEDVQERMEQIVLDKDLDGYAFHRCP